MESTKNDKTMKIEIDTKEKVITIVEDCTLHELVDFAEEHGLIDYEIRVKKEYQTVPIYPQTYDANDFKTTSTTVIGEHPFTYTLSRTDEMN